MRALVKILFVVGIFVIIHLLGLDLVQYLRDLNILLHKTVKTLGGDPNVVLNPKIIFSSEVYGGIIQGFIAAVAIWVTYWTYTRQQKQTLRDRLYEKRMVLYPQLYTELTNLQERLKPYKNDPEKIHSIVTEFINSISEVDYFFYSPNIIDSFDKINALSKKYKKLLEEGFYERHGIESHRGSSYRHINARINILKFRLRSELGINDLSQDLSSTFNKEFYHEYIQIPLLTVLKVINLWLSFFLVFDERIWGKSLNQKKEKREKKEDGVENINNKSPQE